MLNVKVIGIGAAGNKGAIELIEQKVVEKNNVVLLNSTLKDVPAAYKDSAIQIEGMFNGCAKERTIANAMIMNNLQNGKISLDAIMQENDTMVIIITSLEGGTGSGASTVIAKYFADVLNTHVTIIGYSGFEDDSRGMKNTVDWFKELADKWTIQCISNKKFLKENFNNKNKAEKAANAELVHRVKVILGQTISESEQNIDDADLQKIATTPGFMTIETVPIDKIKNVDAFNKAIIEAIDNSKSLDVEPTCKRIGVIIDVRDKTRDSIDGHFDVLRQRYGEPFEFFTHIQNVHENETVTFIIAGLKMPEEEVEALYNAFLARMSSVDNSKDNFFAKNYDTSISQEFDMGAVQPSANQIQANKATFFGSSNSAIKVKNGTAQNINIAQEL